MVFAMHQIQVVTIVRHLEDSPWFEDYLREVVAEQRLIASVTSEIGTGGDMGRSVAAVTPTPEGDRGFEKKAPTVSYGVHADDLFVTLRRCSGRGAGRSGGRARTQGADRRSSRPAPGTRWVCAGRARRASS